MVSASERQRARLLPPSGTFAASEGGTSPFRESVDSIVGTWLGSIDEAAWARLDKAPSLKWTVRAECGRFVAQTLALELNLARACGALVGESAGERYQSFVEGAASDSFLRYVASKYPAMREVLERRVAAGIALYDLIDDAWANDEEALVRILGVTGGRIVDIQPLGDPHRRGLRASRVLFDRGDALMFKPSSSAPAELIRRFSAILANSSGPPAHVPAFLGRRRYHWQEMFPGASTPDVDPVAFGAGLAVAHFTSTADLHFENVTVQGGTMVMLDCEAVLGGRPLLPGQIDLLANDLSITALLPRLMSGGKGVIGPNWGFWGGNHRILNGIPDFETLDDETDRLKYVQSRREESAGQWDHEAVSATWESLREVQDTFVAQLENVGARSDALMSLVRGAAERGLKARIVMRPTQSYFDVLSRSSHPSNLLSWAGYARAVRSALSELDPSSRLDGLLDREVQSLLRGDIPAFWARCDSDELLGSPLASGVSQASIRINEALACPDRMAALYRSDIACHFAAYVINDLIVRDADLIEGRSPSHGLSRVPNIQENLTRIARRIEASSWPGPIDSWVNVHRTGTGIWRRERSGVDLYAGSPGVGIALLQSGQPDVDRAARRINETLGILDSHRFTRAGAFDGEAGAVYALASAARFGASDAAEAARIRSSLNRAFDRIAVLVEQDGSGDVISGSAGTLAVLAALVNSDVAELADVRELAELCVTRLAHLAQEAGRGRLVWVRDRGSSRREQEWHGGFAHGVAGIAWSLRRWATTGQSELASELAVAAEATQASLRRSDFDWDPHRAAFSDGEGRSGWCYGSDGVILAQLDSGLLAEEICDPSWYVSLVSSLARRDQDLDLDLSLCHGRAGRLVLWSRLAAVALDAIGEIPEPVTAALARDTGRIIDAMDGPLDPSRVSFDRWSSSLMLGDAGVLHALHSTLAPQPSPLLLEIRFQR